VLLTGDIEAAQERALLAAYGPSGLRAELMLAPHHGSGTSSSAEFLEAVAPTYAIAQLGFRNRYGHPAQRVEARYRAAGIALLRSDRDGAIVLTYAKGREPRLERSRIDDRRYWRVRLPDDPAIAPSSRRPSPTPRRAPARPRASTGTPSARRVARA
jgi:competence protein ComEC